TEYAHHFAAEYTIAWWISAERPSLVADQLAGLGVAMGWVTPTSDTPIAMREVLRRLHDMTGWLVIFDNVEAPDDVHQWLPQGLVVLCYVVSLNGRLQRWHAPAMAASRACSSRSTA